MAGWNEVWVLLLSFFLSAKCPSAALQTEQWTPVGWLRLEGLNYSYMIVCLFCFLVPEELVWRTLSRRDRVKKGHIMWLNALISIFLQRLNFYVLHRQRHIFTPVSCIFNLLVWYLVAELWLNLLYWNYNKFYASLISVFSYYKIQVYITQKVVE